MAKKYTESDIAGLARQDYTSLSGYEKRLVRGYNNGLSRSQARGHARVTKGEKPASVITGTRGQRARTTTPKEPKITKQVVKLPGQAKLVTTRSTTKIVASLQGLVGGSPQRRVYFQVWDKDRGMFMDVYKGGRAKAHGIPVDEFLRRVDRKLSNGQAKDLDDAVRQVIEEDSAAGSAADYGDTEGAPHDFTQARVYILPTAA